MIVLILSDASELLDELWVEPEGIYENNIQRCNAIRAAIETKHSVFDDVRSYEEYIHDL